MKEHPILFSTPMVQAILQGRKTMTRRVITSRNSTRPTSQKFKDFDWDDVVVDHGAMEPEWAFVKPVSKADELRHSVLPKYQIDDRLWVRETFGKSGNKTFYKADNNDLENAGLRGLYDFKWKPGIHMPRAACRIVLKITKIKAERIEDISEEDAMREGVEFNDGAIDNTLSGYKDYRDYKLKNTIIQVNTAKESFQSLWQSINGPESWNENPWVWVYEFKICEPVTP